MGKREDVRDYQAAVARQGKLVQTQEKALQVGVSASLLEGARDTPADASHSQRAHPVVLFREGGEVARGVPVEVLASFVVWVDQGAAAPCRC